MTTGEAAYLVMVIAGMLAFGGTLAWVSRRPGAWISRRQHGHSAADSSRALRLRRSPEHGAATNR